MRRRVRIHADFRADLRAQITWLRDHRDRDWIDRLRVAIDEAMGLLSSFPDVGTIEMTEGTVFLRRLIPGKLPYAIWYARDTGDPDGDIWLLRLFHERQARPLPSIPPQQASRVRRR